MTRAGQDEQKGITLSQMLESATGVDAGDASILAHGDDIARTSLRIPRAVLKEVSALAQANRISASLLFNLLLDNYLADEGRPSYATLAPWYADYVLRKKPAAD